MFKFDKFPLEFSFWYFWIKKKKVECKLWNLSQTRCLPTASLTCIDRAEISSLIKLGLWYVFYILAVRIKWDNVYLGHIYWVWRRVGSAINVDSFFFSFGDANLGHTCGLLARFYFYSASTHHPFQFSVFPERWMHFLIFCSEIPSFYNDPFFLLSPIHGGPKCWQCVGWIMTPSRGPHLNLQNLWKFYFMWLSDFACHLI